MTALNTDDAQNLYNLGSALGFALWDSPVEIVYFGFFDLAEAREIVFRLKLILQNLSNAYEQLRTLPPTSMTPEALERVELLWSKIRVEVLVSPEVDRAKIVDRVSELTSGFNTRPWVILTQKDLELRVREEYERIGEL